MPVQVSVIMPVYNMTEFVGQSINSILQQSFSDFELIVIDDASEDGIDTVVHSYKDRQIIFERNPTTIDIEKQKEHLVSDFSLYGKES